MESGTAAPATVGTRRVCSTRRSPRAPLRSMTRMGTWRLAISSRARLALMSPMVAMRTVSAIASVVTPSSAATSMRGRIAQLRACEVRRRDDVVEFRQPAGFGGRSEAARSTASSSRPSTATCNSRWPSSWINQKRMSGIRRRSSETSRLNAAGVVERCDLSLRLTMNVALRTSMLEPSTVPPIVRTLFTSLRAAMRLDTISVANAGSALRPRSCPNASRHGAM